MFRTVEPYDGFAPGNILGGGPVAFCANCGAQVQGKFCPQCGTPVAGSAAGFTAPVNPPASVSGDLTENVASALCYLLLVLTGCLFLVLAPYNQNRTIRFHAWQSIFAWGAWLVIAMLVGAARLILGELPFIGGVLSVLLWTAYSLSAFGVWVLLMYKAYQGERFLLPFIGPLAEKQA